jgi:hypothetical protein
VIVGPWLGARGEDGQADAEVGELDVDEESAGLTMQEESEAPPEPEAAAPAPVSEFVAGTLERLASPVRKPGESSVVRLREALGRADRDRLRAEAARLAPLVRRLAALREGASSSL